MDRSGWLLDGLTATSRIVEIGAGAKPLAPKSEGWLTTVVDHVTKADLAKKFSYSEAEVAASEDVDIVTDGASSLDSYFPQSDIGSFDAVINSHVIEHMPDPIAFLASCGNLLKSGGTMRMAVPDKRRCFDYFRPFSTTGEFLEAQQSSVHSQRAAFESVAYAVSFDGAVAWADASASRPAFVHSLALAHACFQRAADRSTYYDLHAWRFSPASFSLIVLELSHLGLLDFRVAAITPAINSEFWVKLEKSTARLTESELADQRMTLLEDIMLDSADQIAAIRRTRRLDA